VAIRSESGDVITHALALGGGVAFIPFTYVVVVSPMAQFFPRDLFRSIEGEWIGYRGVEFGFCYVPAISDPLQGFKKEGSGDRHLRIVADMSNVRNWPFVSDPTFSRGIEFRECLSLVESGHERPCAIGFSPPPKPRREPHLQRIVTGVSRKR
jgi:hypothetical protein